MKAEILPFNSTKGRADAPTEAVNLLIKKVKRIGHGFRNFINYHLRLLLHCGVRWAHSPDRKTARPLSTLTTCANWMAARVTEHCQQHREPLPPWADDEEDGEEP